MKSIISSKNYPSLLFSLLFFIVSLWLVSSHEIYRDEACFWLVTSSSVSLAELLNNLEYDPHPFLWYLIIFPLTKIFASPISMQYLHVLIAATSIFILFRFSPFNTIQKVLFTFSYFLFYEYSIISRNYAIGVLLIFISCALFNKRKKYPYSLAITLFLLSNTSIFGVIFSLCFFSTICLEEFLDKGKKSIKQASIINYFAPVSIVILGFIFAIWHMLPVIDSAFQGAQSPIPWNFQINFQKIEFILRALVNAYFPVPNFNLNFWSSNFFFQNISLRILGSILVLLVVYIFLRFLVSRPSAFFLYISILTALLLFFSVKLSGSIRHHGFLFVALISALWIHNYCKTHKFFLIIKKTKEINKNILDKLIIGLLLVHVGAAAFAQYQDYKYTFSGGKQTANFLEQNGLADATIISSRYGGASVAAYMRNKNFLYANQRSFSSFLKTDKDFFQNQYFFNIEDLYSHSFIYSYDKKNTIILILDSPISEFGIDNYGGFHKIFESDDVIVRQSDGTGEKFYVYILLKELIKN